jgi:hypothetical protein
VKAVLARATAAGEDADSVAAIAERAGRSPRTIYRVLDYPDDKLMALDLADRLLIAANGLLSLDCDDEDIRDDA